MPTIVDLWRNAAADSESYTRVSGRDGGVNRKGKPSRRTITLPGEPASYSPDSLADLAMAAFLDGQPIIATVGSRTTTGGDLDADGARTFSGEDVARWLRSYVIPPVEGNGKPKKGKPNPVKERVEQPPVVPTSPTSPAQF